MEDNPLEMFRKVVSFLYREIGILKPTNHPAVFCKARHEKQFFGPKRKRISREIYQETRDVDDLTLVLLRYEEVTGLAMEDLLKAFSSGDWKNSHGGFSYGGPKWAAIARAAIGLRDALARGDKASAEAIACELKAIKHNNGKLVKKFPELCTSN